MAADRDAAVTVSARDHASVVQVARLPFQAEDGGANPTLALQFVRAGASEIAYLLAAEHYLGPIANASPCFAGFDRDGYMVAASAWKLPTARMLPNDGTWLELARWCLTARAGENAGSRMMGWTRRYLRRHYPRVTTLVSYSDPVHGHTGALYKASGWIYSPTHHSDRYHANGKGYPSGHGSWDGVTTQTPKDRWVIDLHKQTPAPH